MRKRYKWVLIIISVLIIIVSFIAVYKIVNKNEEKPKNTSSVISNIDKYKYTLDDRDTKYMKDTFKELESILDSDEVDNIKYAVVLSKLFIIDFYTLNNKINKYDVGSLEYIFSSKVDNFRLKAMDTIYKDIIDNTYKDRVQDLPEISNVEVLTINEATYIIDEEEYSGYKVNVEFQYKKDLGYDNEGTIILVNNNEKLEVAKFTPKIEEEN